MSYGTLEGPAPHRKRGGTAKAAIGVASLAVLALVGVVWTVSRSFSTSVVSLLVRGSPSLWDMGSVA